MDIKQELLKEHSKENVLRIVSYIGKDKNKFRLLMELFFSKEVKVAQRAAWVFSHSTEHYPHLIEPYLEKLIKNLDHPIHVSQARNTLRALGFVTIPVELEGRIVSICFDFLLDPREAIAVKVFAMTVLGNNIGKYPELIEELEAIINDQWEIFSPGLKSRSKRVLKKFGKKMK